MSSSEPEGARPSRGSTLLWAALAVAGLGGWLAYALGLDAERAFRALLINFAFFTPLGAGMVVWSAIVILARGRWAEPIRDSALCGIALAPPSLIAFAGLWAGKAHWARWLRFEGLPQGIWLAPTFVFIRDGAALVVLWALALRFVRLRRKGRPLALAGALAFAYCMVLSLLAFDLVMALDPFWSSTLFGGYFFISGLYAAVAAWTLVALLERRPTARGPMQDLGKLIVAFSILTTYLMYAQLATIWYENLPREARFLVPRMNDAHWRAVSFGLLAVIYLGPLVVLLTRWSKRTPWFLGAAALAVLVGMWIERWWLVAPTFGVPPRLGLVELSITAAFVGAFGLGIQRYQRMAGPPAEEASRA